MYFTVSIKKREFKSQSLKSLKVNASLDLDTSVNFTKSNNVTLGDPPGFGPWIPGDPMKIKTYRIFSSFDRFRTFWIWNYRDVTVF